MNITLDNGKYTVVCKDNGSLEALRYGEPWRDLTGDNLILALCQRIEKLEAKPTPKPFRHKLPDTSHSTWEWGWKMEWCRINGLACANNDNWNASTQAWLKFQTTLSETNNLKGSNDQ